MLEFFAGALLLSLLSGTKETQDELRRTLEGVLRVTRSEKGERLTFRVLIRTPAAPEHDRLTNYLDTLVIHIAQVFENEAEHEWLHRFMYFPKAVEDQGFVFVAVQMTVYSSCLEKASFSRILPKRIMGPQEALFHRIFKALPWRNKPFIGVLGIRAEGEPAEVGLTEDEQAEVESSWLLGVAGDISKPMWRKAYWNRVMAAQEGSDDITKPVQYAGTP